MHKTSKYTIQYIKHTENTRKLLTKVFIAQLFVYHGMDFPSTSIVLKVEVCNLFEVKIL